MDLGEKIKQNRIKMNLTQQEVADRVFVTRQTISKWELGKSQPDLVSLKLLETVFAASLLREEKENWKMKLTIKDLLFTLLFGIWFLPLRIAYTLLKPYFGNKFVRLIVIPIVGVIFILYMHSLKWLPMLVIVGILLMIYYFFIIFFGDKNLESLEEKEKAIGD